MGPRIAEIGPSCVTTSRQRCSRRHVRLAVQQTFVLPVLTTDIYFSCNGILDWYNTGRQTLSLHQQRAVASGKLRSV
eukprot:9498557-Pyramimonas_sp.AAC.1